ncbi:hypothetical protein BaRGS_00026433 [Batillaria attramentaria]|uniref:Uncharacterized protein n=1 Tax=Batillaria attramentaria TaxID=370345 RepID=A0ABD0K5T5_9CAEN
MPAAPPAAVLNPLPPPGLPSLLLRLPRVVHTPPPLHPSPEKDDVVSPTKSRASISLLLRPYSCGIRTLPRSKGPLSRGK